MGCLKTNPSDNLGLLEEAQPRAKHSRTKPQGEVGSFSRKVEDRSGRDERTHPRRGSGEMETKDERNVREKLTRRSAPDGTSNGGGRNERYETTYLNIRNSPTFGRAH